MNKNCENCIWTECEEHGVVCPFYEVEDLIDNAETVEYPFYQEAYQTGYEEGKNEKPQGEWIHYLGCGIGKAVCSKCGQLGEIRKSCGNCGADMKGGAENG